MSVVRLVAGIVLWSATIAAAVHAACSYVDYKAVESGIEEICRSNDSDRLELARLEAELDESRGSVKNLLVKERQVCARTEELRKKAADLERKWEMLKSYSRRLEDIQKEIENIRRWLKAAEK